MDELYTENDKIRKRNKDLTRQVEDLQLENIKLQKRIDDMDDSHNVLEDDLYKIKGELKNYVYKMMNYTKNFKNTNLLVNLMS